MHIKSIGWNTETKYIANRVRLITGLRFTQFKGTSDHSELRLLNQKQKEWGEGKPVMPDMI